MAFPPRLSLAGLADGAAGFPLLDDAGRVSVPLLAVDLPGNLASGATDAVWRRAAVQAANCPRLLVGLAYRPLPAAADGLLRALSLTLTAAEPAGRACLPWPDPQAGAQHLAEAADRSPRAAIVLGQVLRATGVLSVRAALDLESMAYSTLLGGPEFRQWLESQPVRPAPQPVAEPVLVRRMPGARGDGEQLLITLNRPERRNAYGRQLRDALADALRVALFDPAVTEVTLDGSGPCFSSGGDLADFGTAPDLVTAHLVRTQAGAGLLLDELRGRIQVRVHGPCVGAGVELPAFAAKVIAAPGTTFRLPEVAMGLIPGAGGTVSLPRRIGRWRTLHLALSGQPLAAESALSWGLVDSLAT